jgi:starch synthase
MTRPLRVLHIAELANPEWVSVPLVGWNHSRALARLCDVHLVTQVRNRPAILRSGLKEGQDFTAIDNDALDKAAYKFGLWLRGGEGRGLTIATALSSLTHYAFEYLIWKQFGSRIEGREFDVVHRITPVSPATPSLLASKCKEAGVPFVLGPLNGGVPWPREFSGTQKREGEWLSHLRKGFKLLPGYRSTRTDSAAIMAGSRWTVAELSPYADKVIYQPENAVDPSRFDLFRQGAATLPLRVGFVGRLVPLKAVDMLLDAALPLLSQGKITLEIIGDGPELGPLQSRVESSGVTAQVSFPGWMTHDQLKERLTHFDVFGFPSIREFGGGAALEAMAMGLVPIVMDYGGPAELITPDTGFAIPMQARDKVVAQMRKTLEHLVEHPEIIEPMGLKARERVLKHFTWEARAAQTLEVYRWVLGRRPDKPDFGMPLGNGGLHEEDDAGRTSKETRALQFTQ